MQKLSSGICKECNGIHRDLVVHHTFYRLPADCGCHTVSTRSEACIFGSHNILQVGTISIIYCHGKKSQDHYFKTVFPPPIQSPSRYQDKRANTLRLRPKEGPQQRPSRSLSYARKYNIMFHAFPTLLENTGLISRNSRAPFCSIASN